jgi:hypothetical protein
MGWWKAVPMAAALLAAGCSREDPTPVTLHAVDVSWAPNREVAVNAPGGGYQVTIGPLWGGPATMPPIDVPYLSGELAPTSLTTTLASGAYRVTVRAYGLAPGGAATTSSEPSQATVRVP